METKYEYIPLDKDKEETRLLRITSIIPGQQYGFLGDCIMGSIEHTSMTDTPYIALSYCWGTPEYTSAVITDYGYVPITSNLLVALWHAYKVEESLSFMPIWVDAISINQVDDEEKSWQVEQMGKIFSGASKTLIFLDSWPLSNKDGYVEDGMTYIQHIGQTAVDHGIFKVQVPILDCIDRVFQRHLSRETTTPVYDELEKLIEDLLIENNSTMNAVGLEKQFHFFCLYKWIMECPWWQRMWVVQELYLSSTAIFIYGLGTIRCELLIAVGKLLGLIVTKVNPAPVHYRVGTAFNMIFMLNSLRLLNPPAAELFYLREWHLNQPQGRLELNLSDIFGTFEKDDFILRATDPRDHIYGLLGVISKWNTPEQSIYPDYTMSSKSLFTRCAIVLIEQGWQHLLRAAVHSRAIKSHHLELPSWVPDYSAKTMSSYFAEPPPRLARWQYIVKDSSNHDPILVLFGNTFGPIRNLNPTERQIDSNCKGRYQCELNWANDKTLVQTGLQSWTKHLSNTFNTEKELSVQKRMLALSVMLATCGPCYLKPDIMQLLSTALEKVDAISDNWSDFWNVAARLAQILEDISVVEAYTYLFELSNEGQENLLSFDPGYEKLLGVADIVDARTPLEILVALATVGNVLHDHSAFVAGNRYTGVASGKIKDGDVLCRFFMDPTSLFVIRPTREEGRYRLVTRAVVPELWREESFEQEEVMRIELC